jgi:hypothetical protein
MNLIVSHPNLSNETLMMIFCIIRGRFVISCASLVVPHRAHVLKRDKQLPIDIIAHDFVILHILGLVVGQKYLQELLFAAVEVYLVILDKSRQQDLIAEGIVLDIPVHPGRESALDNLT